MKTSTSSSFLRQLFAPLCVAIFSAFLATSVNAQTTIVGWDFNGLSGYGSSPQAPGSKDANVTAVGLTRSGLGTSGTAASNAWGGTGNGSASFTVKANAGYTLSLTQISAYNVRRSGTGATTGQWAYSLDGTTFVNIGSAITWGSTTTSSGNAQTAITLSGISALQNLPATTTVTFRVTLTGATTGTWYLNQFQAGDDFVVTGTVAASGPTIGTTGTLSAFTTPEGTASAAQTFNATGANLTTDITVTAPTDFEVATDGATFVDTATITQSGGSASGTVSVRIKASATAGSKSGNVVLSSTGATSVNVPVTGTVTAVGVPLITLSTNNIIGLSTSTGSPSAATNYTVTGTNLGTTDVSVTPNSALLQVGTNGTDFTNSLNLTPAAGVVSNTIYLRVAATNVVTNYSATISHVSGSASNSLAVSGAITNLPPSLAANPTSITGLNAVTTNTPSDAQTFTVTGSNLTNNVTISAPLGFEIANDGTNWASSTSLVQTSGSVSGTISVRLAASSAFGPRSGSVTNVSGTLTNRVSVSGSSPVPNIPGQVYWNFDTATPTSGTGGDYASWTFPAVTQNNNNGTTTLLTTTSASSGYTNPYNVLASGTTNAGAAARTGAFNAATSTFFEVQIVVPSNTTTGITNISFGSRSTGTGPAAYSIRSSIDNFAADIVTNAMTTNSTWTMYAAPVALALSNGTNILRIYGYNGAGTTTAGTANWRIDDLTLALAAGVLPPAPSGLSYTPSTTNAVVGVAIGNLTPSVTGTVTNYSVNPALPGGLLINPANGVISGTPTTATASASYTVTAANAGGSTTATVTITVASAYQGWLNGQPTNSTNQLNYAIGGASNALATNGIAMSNAVTSSNLSITAIVRTNDPNLSVFGQSIIDLGPGTWSTNDVSRITNGVDQSGVPAGNQRQIFSTPLGSDGKKFLRLQTTLSNQ